MQLRPPEYGGKTSRVYAGVGPGGSGFLNDLLGTYSQLWRSVGIQSEMERIADVATTVRSDYSPSDDAPGTECMHSIGLTPMFTG